MSSCCYIREVKTGYPLPVRAEVVTDLSEHLPIFDPSLVRIAELARDEHRPVYLDIRRSDGARHRYISRIHVMIAEMQSRCCIRCCEESPQKPATEYSGVPYFECSSCHCQMFIGRVPRVRSELDVLA